jgi:hypothetical protein
MTSEVSPIDPVMEASRRRLLESSKSFICNSNHPLILALSSPYRAKNEPLSSKKTALIEPRCPYRAKNSPYRAKLPLSSENPTLIQPLSSGSIRVRCAYFFFQFRYAISDIGVTCPYRALIQPLSNPLSSRIYNSWTTTDVNSVAEFIRVKLS